MKNKSIKKNYIKDFFSGNNGWLFLIPSILILFLVMYYPITYAIGTSFTNMSIEGANFVGLSNYIEVFKDQTIIRPLFNTVIYTIFSVFFQLVLGFFAAYYLNFKIKGRTIFRTLLLIPWLIPPVVTAMTWQWIYDSHFGVLNSLLFEFHLIKVYLSWLGDPKLALASVIFVNIWRGYPFMMIMILAGLQAIPREQYEAANIDGANNIKQVIFITIPNLKYILSVAVLLTSIWSFKDFDLVKILTSGGPAGSTEVLSTIVYHTSFKYFDFGRGSTIAVYILMILLVLSSIYLKASKRQGT